VDAADVARRCVELWYEPEREDELRALLADGYIHHAPRADLTAEQFIGQLRLINAALTDMDYEIVQTVVEGNMVAVLVRAEGTQTGELFGAPATGRRGSTAGATFMRIEDGRVAEDWDAWALHTLFMS
jgi:predicted ester cyclase